jgi:plasmid stabilization system protein ParE
MPFKIVFSPKAQNDLIEIYDWYEKKLPGLGERFINVLDKRILILTRTPHIFPIRYKEIRCTLVPDFPYLIHYDVSLSKQMVTIYRVFHTSRKPLWE